MREIEERNEPKTGHGTGGKRHPDVASQSRTEHACSTTGPILVPTPTTPGTSLKGLSILDPQTTWQKSIGFETIMPPNRQQRIGTGWNWSRAVAVPKLSILRVLWPQSPCVRGAICRGRQCPDDRPLQVTWVPQREFSGPRGRAEPRDPANPASLHPFAHSPRPAFEDAWSRPLPAEVDPRGIPILCVLGGIQRNERFCTPRRPDCLSGLCVVQAHRALGPPDWPPPDEPWLDAAHGSRLQRPSRRRCR